jgi:hypothetical protein
MYFTGDEFFPSWQLMAHTSAYEREEEEAGKEREAPCSTG